MGPGIYNKTKMKIPKHIAHTHVCACHMEQKGYLKRKINKKTLPCGPFITGKFQSKHFSNNK